MKRAAVIVAALALAAPAAAAEITVTGQVVRTNKAPLPPVGISGDAVSQRWLIRDRHARPIGDLLVDCRWVTSGLRLCVGQLSMPLGVIAVIGATRTRFLGQMVIAGGTGPYVGAEGTLLFKAIGTGRYTLSLTYRKEKP